MSPLNHIQAFPVAANGQGRENRATDQGLALESVAIIFERLRLANAQQAEVNRLPPRAYFWPVAFQFQADDGSDDERPSKRRKIIR